MTRIVTTSQAVLVLAAACGEQRSDEYSGTVEVGVVVFDPAEQAMLDERYGEGVVELVGRLQPVE